MDDVPLRQKIITPPVPAFEQAKTQGGDPSFLQIKAKPKRPARARPKREEPAAKLTRIAFRVSRLMEFCTERELVN